MKDLISRWFSIPWYPCVFATYPIIALFAINIQQAELDVLFRPLLISLAGSSLLLLILWLIIRDWQRAAFATALLIILFFTYGHIYNYLKAVYVFGFAVGRHRFLLLLWVVLVLLAVGSAVWKKVKIREHTASINSISLVLLAFPLYTVIGYFISVSRVTTSPQIVQNLSVAADQAMPDIYYIILDSYTRSDVLKNAYGYDNSDFLNNLKGIGFYIADCSTSNYMWTNLSVSSTLNMEYLQDDPTYSDAAEKDIVVEDLLKHSLVRKTLESLGYTTVAFATGFPFNEITDADLYLEPPALMESVREFDALLVQTTLLRVPQDFGLIYINQTASARYRDRTLFAISHFDDLARLGGPKFVYIHIITPHPPFVFGRNGEYLDPIDFIRKENAYTSNTYSQGYIDQLFYISNQITQSVQQLITESPEPPVIIIQGDHGPWKQEGENRVSILNAYYLPGHQDSLYTSISPVNTFRIILGEYFSADYPLLEDVSYASKYRSKHEFTIQPTSCGGN